MEIIFINPAKQIVAASWVLLVFLKLCADETIMLQLFATKIYFLWIRRENVVEDLDVKAAPGILIASYTGDKLTFAAKYFVPSFEIEQEFMTLVITEGLKKGALD